jgi:hypothetical protein
VASKAERDARLDELETATEEWAAKRKTYLENQAAIAKKLLKGRTGMERLNNQSVQKASSLLVDEINQFLSGE